MTRRRAGHTLVELTASLGAATVLVGAAVAVVLHAERDRVFVAALAEDARGLRRAAAAIERDVRTARVVRVSGDGLDADEVAWRLVGDTLRRGDEVLARRVAEFRAETADAVAPSRDGAVRVRIELAPLTPGAARRAGVTTTTRPRAGEVLR